MMNLAFPSSIVAFVCVFTVCMETDQSLSFTIFFHKYICADPIHLKKKS